MAGTLLLRGGIIHTVSGPTLTNASVFVRDGRIASVGETPGDAPSQTIELNGSHLFPGLVAPTTVLGLTEIDAVRATRDTTDAGDYTPDVYSWVAVNPDSELIPVARANGYTHVQPVPMGGVVCGHSAVITLSGWTVEDFAVKRAAALHVIWPSFTLNTRPKSEFANPDEWKSLEDQVKERDRNLQDIDQFFNEAEAYARLRPHAGNAANSAPVPGEGSPRLPVADGRVRVPAWESMLPALRKEIPIFIHADEVRQIRSAIEWAARRGYRVVLAGGRDAWTVADLLATHGIPVAYDEVFTPPSRDTDSYDAHYGAPAVLARAGVKVAFAGGTSRFGASNLRNVPYAAAQAMAFGLPREEAIKGLTLYPAEFLGLEDHLGSIEPGKEATFFVADGDILDIRTQVKRMWIGGNEVSLETRHTRLYERYRGRPRALELEAATQPGSVAPGRTGGLQ
jgi:imidazolonepropionase-like amidohydrolase